MNTRLNWWSLRSLAAPVQSTPISSAGKLFKDKDGNPPEAVTKKVKGKNVEVTRVETSGHYFPARFPGRPAEPDRPDARLLGAIVIGNGTSFFIRMVGPNKTMNKISPDFDALLGSLKLEGK